MINRKNYKYLKYFGNLINSLFAVALIFTVYINPALAAIPTKPVPTTPAPTTTTAPKPTTTPPATTSSASPEKSIGEYLCTPTDTNLYDCINKIYRFSIVVGFVIAVMFIVFAGYLYMTGGEKGITQAKSIVSSTGIALVIMITSFILLKQINPNLVVFKSIQPPEITKSDIGDYVPIDVPVLGENSGADGPGDQGAYTGTFPRFTQAEGPWADQSYGCGNTTVGSSGCGPASLAEVIQFYKNKGQIRIDPAVQSEFGDRVDPGVIATLALRKGFRVCGSGTSGAMFASIGGLYGLKADSSSWNSAKQAIQNGTPVIAAMGPGYFTGGGHYIVLYGIDSSGNILVADPGPRNRISAPENVVSSEQHGLYIMHP